MELRTDEADFEYDEAFGEDFEAAGETDESDESDEGMEADYELSTEQDETDESFEMDEQDESDESDLELAMEMDESDEASAGLSATASTPTMTSTARGDAIRARLWRGQLARDRRREVQRASSTQKDISRRIQSIPNPPPARTYTVAPLRGAGVVTAVLPNGRRTQMRLTPSPAPVSEVNKLRAVINMNDKRQAAAIGANTRAITGLAKTQAAAVKKLTADQVKTTQDLAKRIVEGDTRLDKRITKELGSGKGGLGKHQKRIYRMIRRQRQRSLWNNILLTSAMPLFAAYGERENPLARNNLILTGSLAGWLLGDELLDQYMKAPGKAGRTTSGIANVWSYVAPIGNAATAYLLLRNRQHERFVTGTATFDAVAANTVGTKEVTELGIATDTFEDEFSKAGAGKIAAVATIVGTTVAEVVPSAEVVGGKLILRLAAGGTAVAAGTKVAWMIDTKPLAS